MQQVTDRSVRRYSMMISAWSVTITTLTPMPTHFALLPSVGLVPVLPNSHCLYQCHEQRASLTVTSVHSTVYINRIIF